MSTCPPNPAPPDGYKIWRGPVPRPLSQWAVDQRDNWMMKPGTAYGDTVGVDYVDPATGQSSYVVARKDHHTWTYAKGQLVKGICIPGITLYQPELTMAALAGGPGERGVGDVTDTLESPDPTVAAYTLEQGTNWGLVAISGLAALGVVGAFWAGLHFAGTRTSHVQDNPTKLSHRELATMANDIARQSRYGGSAPRLQRTSSRKDVIAWLKWNDPNGVYTDAANRVENYRPLTTDEAWVLLEEMVTQG